MNSTVPIIQNDWDQTPFGLPKFLDEAECLVKSNLTHRIKKTSHIRQIYQQNKHKNPFPVLQLRSFGNKRTKKTKKQC
jgi:hypothetical protein